MHFSLQLSKHPLTLKQDHPPPQPWKKAKERWGGLGEEQGRKDSALITAQWLTWFKTEPTTVGPKDAFNSWLWLKTNLSHFWFIEVRQKKKNSSQIHINTRLQLLLLLLLLLCKVFHLFLQGLATASQPLTSTRSATATGGRHKAWKSFSAGASPWNTLHCTQGGAWPVLFSHRAALVLPIQIAECVHSGKKLSLLKDTVIVSAAEQSVCLCVCVRTYIYMYI